MYTLARSRPLWHEAAVLMGNGIFIPRNTPAFVHTVCLNQQKFLVVALSSENACQTICLPFPFCTLFTTLRNVWKGLAQQVNIVLKKYFRNKSCCETMNNEPYYGIRHHEKDFYSSISSVVYSLSINLSMN